jgi:glutathione S-transferase
MIRLHVFPPSPNAIKVIAAAHHLGIEFETRLVDLTKGGQQEAEFVALNPNRKIPVLEEDGFVLWESNAILQYLASKKPEKGLWPTDPRKQADVSRWQFWQTAHWGPACGILTFERFVKRLLGQGDPNPSEIERGEKDFRAHAAVLDGHLKDRRWVAGDALTVADISIGAWMAYAAPAQYPLAGLKEIGRWYGALAELPAWKKALPS